MIVLTLGFCASATAQDFTGFYVGGTGGGNFGHARVDTSPIFSPTGYFATTSTPAIANASNQDISPKKYTFGGQIGYNRQWDNFVFGVEADFSTMSMDSSATATQVYPCCAPTAFTVVQTAKTNWMFNVRPRVGFVAGGKTLFYGTAGVAFTGVQYSALFTDTFATAHENASLDQNKAGWIVGGGIEYRLNHHWSIKGEYLYAGFSPGTVTSTNLTAFSPPIPFPTNIFTHNIEVKAQLPRGGVNFRF